MAEKIRVIIQRLKDKMHLPQISASGRDRVDRIVTKYVPATRVTEIAEKLKYETVRQRVRDVVSRYEKFTGVEEIMAIQNTVIDAQKRKIVVCKSGQLAGLHLLKDPSPACDVLMCTSIMEKFISAQDRRRDVGRQLANLEARLKELHAEMQNIMKGDEKYLQLCTEEHKLIIQERALRALFSDAEREERELFATMSAAVKLGHERERAHAERNKYWYIVASIFGTVLGIAGSTLNNHLKMAEFRDMMEQQMARSASVLYTIAGGGSASRADITEAMKTEFAYQEQLAQSLRTMQDNINHLVNKQTSLIEHLHQRENSMDIHLRELRRSIILASQSSAKSDAELAKALSVVHHDLEDNDQGKIEDQSKVLLEPNQILTGIGVIMCLAIILGNVIGRVS